jgi:hypothetical protein
LTRRGTADVLRAALHGDTDRAPVLMSDRGGYGAAAERLFLLVQSFDV